MTEDTRSLSRSLNWFERDCYESHVQRCKWRSVNRKAAFGGRIVSCATVRDRARQGTARRDKAAHRHVNAVAEQSQRVRVLAHAQDGHLSLQPGKRTAGANVLNSDGTVKDEVRYRKLLNN